MTVGGRDLFRARIGEVIGVSPSRVSLFAKGRVALYAILKALDVGPGDEVILPAFTCVAVPNAILYTGARPIYVDIDPLTYTIDTAAAEVAITPQTRAILAQNTFGLSSDLDALGALAARVDVQIIDDCTHGLGGQYHGRPNGSIAPASFFSTQWSKTISTGLGGFAIARDEALALRLRELEEAAAEPTTMSVALLRVLLFGLEHGGHGAVFRNGRGLYRRLSRIGVVPSSSSRDELEGVTMPKGFMTRLSPSQARSGVARIGHLAGQVRRRQAIAERYTDWLSRHALTAAAEPAGLVHAYLRYPLRVRDRPAFISAAGRAGVDLGDWFISPIHPVVGDFERWQYHPGSAPIADRTCLEIVNLPTNPSMSGRDVERVIAFLGQQVASIQ